MERGSPVCLPKCRSTIARWINSRRLARLLGAVNILPVIGLALVALRWLDRITAGWTRRRILAAVLLMLTHAAIAAVSADQWFDIVASGVVGGAVSTLLFATVLIALSVRRFSDCEEQPRLPRALAAPPTWR